MRPARTTNIDNDPGFTILDSEIRRRLTNQSKRSRGMNLQNRVPLLIVHLVDHAVPRVSGVVDNNMNLAVSKLGRFFHKHFDVVGVRDVAGHAEGSVGGGVVDCFRHGVGSGAVHVADNHFGAFVGEQAGAFGADSLS